MKKLVFLLMAVSLLGCAANSYRCIMDAQAQHNTSYIKVPGDIDHARSLVRNAIKSMSLVEMASETPKEPKEKSGGYLICKTSSSWDNFAHALSGQPPAKLMAFFFDYDAATNMTDIKIVEKTDPKVEPMRDKVIDAIKKAM